ncbi:hypothetical protein BDY17DRAFT_257788 [Neohortaea acidophila]|uniref:DnaJ homologue subfamily C member 28 conserved domain-containing protein n=1 Tax=Neohortaea acidophila TaxID=245834 RepID=A0A6A6PGT9_9PEZI|nr:uncharacterized protein BDY17DRAFT_257788 [Neohortaea acidophila]KAF2479218.1 hypothetical protein BDY17DRAFT_257788 [Neohortaea acidophila]
MRSIARRPAISTARCPRLQHAVRRPASARYAHDRPASSQTNAINDGEQSQPRQKEEEKEEGGGAFSRRLAQMSEENIESGGRSAVKAVEEAGFSEELKNRLMEKVANANFRNDNPQAFAQVGMPASAGRGTRDIAAARPWAGQEATEDAALRMLDDAHRRIRVPSKTPVLGGPRGPPSKIDTGRPKHKPATGVRLANARDKVSSYELTKDSGLSEEERQKFRESMKARFAPGARNVAASVQGLASLANERIEDAIARGQFKNLPRGKKLERDHNANSPFIDTTEYLMNKMIQKQDIVPPWIEKQQELMSTASKFRSRMRADWRRHVARLISSKGGGLDKQLRLAEEYALAEAIENPPRKKEFKINAVDGAGHLSQITLAGEMKVTPAEVVSADENDAKVEAEIEIMEQSFNDDGTLKSKPDATVTISAEQPSHQPEAVNPEVTVRTPTVPPFRDPQWEQTERGYHQAAINHLNGLARSYNLMAPSIARKPYYYLDRELKACFADVAPQIASFIRERALAPKVRDVQITGGKPSSVLHQFSTAHSSHVYDERKPQYGFKEFWRDLFAGSKT